MKLNKFIKILKIILVTLSLTLISGSKVLAACDPIPTCIPGDLTKCPSSSCDGCSWCQSPQSGTSIINPALPPSLSLLSGETFLQKFLSAAIALVFTIGSIYFVFTLFLGGIRWISSSGDKTQLEAAQKQLTNAFIGLVILFSGFAIIKLIESIFGVDILNITLPTIGS